jgi:hypothetical protein
VIGHAARRAQHRREPVRPVGDPPARERPAPWRPADRDLRERRARGSRPRRCPRRVPRSSRPVAAPAPPSRMDSGKRERCTDRTGSRWCPRTAPRTRPAIRSAGSPLPCGCRDRQRRGGPDELPHRRSGTRRGHLAGGPGRNMDVCGRRPRRRHEQPAPLQLRPRRHRALPFGLRALHGRERPRLVAQRRHRRGTAGCARVTRPVSPGRARGPRAAARHVPVPDTVRADPEALLAQRVHRLQQSLPRRVRVRGQMSIVTFHGSHPASGTAPCSEGSPPRSDAVTDRMPEGAYGGTTGTRCVVGPGPLCVSAPRSPPTRARTAPGSR